MLNRTIPALLCAIISTALFADPVELRSSDGFIGVEGEIVGFDGAMVSLATSVGVVRVPAAEVICIGEGCLKVLANNSFGLAANDFESVIVAEAAIVQQMHLLDTLTVGIPSSNDKTLFSTLTSAFAVSSDTQSKVDLSDPSRVVLRNDGTNETAELAVSAKTGSAVGIKTVSLEGGSPARYNGPREWSASEFPTDQMLALGAYAVVISPDIGITDITMNDLARIFAGEIKNWSELDGPDRGILPLQLPLNASTRNDLIELVMEPAGKEIAGNVLTMADEVAIANSVKQFPGAISFVSVKRLGDNTPLPVAGTCGIPVAANQFNISSGDYPLVRPIMVSYAGSPKTKLPIELFDFAATQTAGKLLERTGYMERDVTVQSENLKNSRLSAILGARLQGAEKEAGAEMLQVLFNADRLTPTLTGGVVSGPEGAWNRAQFMYLEDAFQRGEFEGKQIVFVGFAESDQGVSSEIKASQMTSAEMLAAFQAFAPELVGTGGVQTASYGFGGVAPASCYDGQVGGDIRSRVEIWLRNAQ